MGRKILKKQLLPRWIALGGRAESLSLHKSAAWLRAKFHAANQTALTSVF
jgi:hypothetical protein